MDASTTTSKDTKVAEAGFGENGGPENKDPEKHAQEYHEETEAETEYPHGLKLAVILSALCLAVFLVALDQTIISTAIPTITDVGTSKAAISDETWH